MGDSLGGGREKAYAKRMKLRLWLPMAVYALCLVGGVIGMLVLAGELPVRVATHFNFAGRPDGWMSNTAFIGSFSWFLVLFPLLVPTLVGLISLNPRLSFNIPRKEYWRRPENWKVACWVLFRSSFWVSAAKVVFAFGLFYLTAEANRSVPPVLNGTGVAGLAAFLLCVVMGWIGYALWFFMRDLKPRR